MYIYLVVKIESGIAFTDEVHMDTAWREVGVAQVAVGLDPHEGAAGLLVPSVILVILDEPGQLLGIDATASLPVGTQLILPEKEPGSSGDGSLSDDILKIVFHIVLGE